MAASDILYIATIVGAVIFGVWVHFTKRIH